MEEEGEQEAISLFSAPKYHFRSHSPTLALFLSDYCTKVGRSHCCTSAARGSFPLTLQLWKDCVYQIAQACQALGNVSSRATRGRT